MVHRSPVRSTLEGAALLLLISAPLVSMVLYGGVRITLYAPLVLAQCVGAIFLLSVRFIWGGGFRVPVAWLGLLAVAGYCLAAVPTAAVPYAAKLECLKWFGYGVAYWGLTDLLNTRVRRQAILGLFLLLGSLLCWYAIIQHARGSSLVLVVPRPEVYGMRASATFICPNHFAHVAELLLVAGVGMAILPGSRWSLRLVGGYAALLALPALLLTQSRSGWAGAGVGLTSLAILVAARRSRSRMLMVGVLSVFAGALLVGALWVFSPVFKQRVTDALEGDMRPEVWADTLVMIRDAPVFGQGPGSFRWVYPHYKDAFRMKWTYPRYAHNEYLNTVAEYGFVGSALAAGAVLFFCIRLLLGMSRVSDAGHASAIAMVLACVFATAVHALFDFQLHIFANMQLMILLAALASSALFEGQSKPAWQPPKGLGEVVCVAGAIGCLVLAVGVGQMLASALLTARAEQYTESRELPEALAAAQEACRLQPGDWEAHKARGLVLKAEAYWSADPERRRAAGAAAVDAFTRVMELNPWDYQTLLELSVLHGDILEQPEASLAFIEEAIEMVPGMAFNYAQLGYRLRKMGRLDEAMEALRRSRQYDREDETVVETMRELKKEIRRRDYRERRESKRAAAIQRATTGE